MKNIRIILALIAFNSGCTSNYQISSESQQVLPRRVAVLPTKVDNSREEDAVIMLTAVLISKGYDVVERINVGALNNEQAIGNSKADGKSTLESYLEKQKVESVIFISTGDPYSIRFVEVGTGKVLWAAYEYYNPGFIYPNNPLAEIAKKIKPRR